MKPKQKIKLKEEDAKHLDAGFLEVTYFPEWLSNF